MDFFQYANYSEIFGAKNWLGYIIGGLCFAIVFIFEAVALFTIASRNGYKNKWMAFIPFFNTYYIGVCAQKNGFYKINAKTIGLVAAIFEAVLVALCVFDEITFSILKNSGYLLKEIETTPWGEFETYVVSNDIPRYLEWAKWVYMYLAAYFIRILSFFYLFVEVILLICFFQTYACRRYVLFSITSAIFPIMGILFFIVRNNKAMNYREFMRAEQARQYQQYQQYRQQNYDNNPYNQNYNQNPYNRNPYNNYNNPPQNGGSGADPFDEFGGSGNNSNNTPPNDPFDDFDK